WLGVSRLRGDHARALRAGRKTRDAAARPYGSRRGDGAALHRSHCAGARAANRGVAPLLRARPRHLGDHGAAGAERGAHLLLLNRPDSRTEEQMDINIGIEADKRREIAAERVLADTYTLYLKTHNFHWNVTGPMFQTLHLMFEAQYTELALAVDLIAERIRTLGHPAPGSYADYAKLSSIRDATGVPAATKMI